MSSGGGGAGAALGGGSDPIPSQALSPLLETFIISCGGLASLARINKESRSDKLGCYGQ